MSCVRSLLPNWTTVVPAIGPRKAHPIPRRIYHEVLVTKSTTDVAFLEPKKRIELVLHMYLDLLSALQTPADRARAEEAIDHAKLWRIV